MPARQNIVLRSAERITQPSTVRPSAPRISVIAVQRRSTPTREGRNLEEATRGDHRRPNGSRTDDPLTDAAPKLLTMILISGHGDTQAFSLEQQMRAQGWIPRRVNLVKITYPADAFQGELSTEKGAVEIVKAYTAAHCGGAAPCELHGASLGANPASRASKRLGLPNAITKVVLHIAPNPATGAWHSLNNDTLIDAFDQFRSQKHAVLSFGGSWAKSGR
jgi:hypothetical protein